MKTYQLILAGATILALASCSKLNENPKFNSADSFAAFNKTALSATEMAGKVQIPVTISSLEPIQTTVTYSVDTEKSTAVAGTHFNLVDPSAVLSFNGTDRTAYIELEIIPIEGVFTGDKVVVIKLENANGIKLGAESVCNFTINDLDHPLSDILGKYAITDGSASGTITIVKDATDLSVVHFPDLIPGLAAWLGSSGSFDIIGQVSADHKTIVIPLPVETGYTYSNGQPLKIFACDPERIYTSVASITLTATETGFSSGEYGLWGYIVNTGANSDWGWDPFTLVKQ